MSAKLPPDSAFRQATNRHPSWLLLKRLAHWERYARVRRGGYTWVAKSHEDWAGELDCTPRQVRRWLQRLRDEGLIVCKQHLFNNRPVGHARLTRLARSRVFEGAAYVAPQRAACGDRQGAAYAALQGAAPYNTGTTVEHHRDSQVRATADGQRAAPEGAGMASSVGEIQERLRANREHETSDEHLEGLVEAAAESGSMKALERVWRCCWLRTQGVFYRSWSSREQHQARELVDQLEDMDLAVSFIRAAVERWSSLASSVKKDAALRDAPQRPAIGWLLRYRTDAWAWFDRAGATRPDEGMTIEEALADD